jgi:hypothetical protein
MMNDDRQGDQAKPPSKPKELGDWGGATLTTTLKNLLHWSSLYDGD